MCDENGENVEFLPFEKPYHGDVGQLRLLLQILQKQSRNAHRSQNLKRVNLSPTGLSERRRGHAVRSKRLVLNKAFTKCLRWATWKSLISSGAKTRVKWTLVRRANLVNEVEGNKCVKPIHHYRTRHPEPCFGILPSFINRNRAKPL